MTTYEPGTVAVATVRGIHEVRVFRRRDHHGVERWESADTINGWAGHGDDHITDVRPLVVLDLHAANPGGDPRLVMENIVAALRRGTHACNGVADQIEAQTKPPRIPEPGPTGSLVNAEGCLWAKADDGNWVCLGDGNSGLTKPWQFLINPEAVTS